MTCLWPRPRPGWCLCERTGDARARGKNGARLTVAGLAAAEPLRKLPTQPFPAVIEAQRVVSAQALVAWNGNFYSVPPGHAGRQVIVRHKLGAATLDVMTAAGTVRARHHREPDGAGAISRDSGHVAALEAKVLAARAASAGGPCHRKARRPPSAAALAEAAAIRGERAGAGGTVTDFAAYAAAARPLRPDRPAQPAQQQDT